MKVLYFFSDEFDLDNLDLDSLEWSDSQSTSKSATANEGLNDPFAFLDSITDDPNKDYDCNDDSSLFPPSPEPISPTLGSAFTPVIQQNSLQNSEFKTSSSFTFPDLLPPSSELPLLDIELGDLEMCRADPVSEDQICNSYPSLPAQDMNNNKTHNETSSILASENYGNGAFSELLNDGHMSSSTIPQQRAQPFNVFLSGHDYTNKMEECPSFISTQQVPSRFIPQPHATLLPPSAQFIHPMNNSVPAQMKVHYPIQQVRAGNLVGSPVLYSRAPIYQNVVVSAEKARSENKEEDRMFQCTYANCGKVYAKSSHLKVSKRIKELAYKLLNSLQ